MNIFLTLFTGEIRKEMNVKQGKTEKRTTKNVKLPVLEK